MKLLCCLIIIIIIITICKIAPFVPQPSLEYSATLRLVFTSLDSETSSSALHPTANLVEVTVTLRLTVSQSVSLGAQPHLGLMTRYLLLFDSYNLVSVGVLSD
jgi:hypothetical protein